MAVRNTSGRPRSGAAPARNTRTTTGRVPAKKAAPVAAVRKRDHSQYADKPASAYHKALARWILTEVLQPGGVDLNSLSAKAAFLKGVSIAVAARPVFNASDAYEEFRENSGEAKRGPKPKAAEEAPAKRGPGRPAKAKPAPEPVEEEEEEWEEEDEIDSEDDDFDSDVEDDSDDEDDSEEDDDEDADFEEEEPEPAPVKRGPGRPRKAAAPVGKSNSRAATAGKSSARGAAPAKSTKPAAEDDDDFLF